MATTLIKNADWLVTMDAERRIIRHGALLIEDDRIVKVAKTSAFKGRARADSWCCQD
jgi:5-methylthioadenosine/S-adenosylhomocysteine deaminase